MNDKTLTRALTICLIVVMVVIAVSTIVNTYRDLKPAPSHVQVWICDTKAKGDCRRAPEFDR